MAKKSKRKIKKILRFIPDKKRPTGGLIRTIGDAKWRVKQMGNLGPASVCYRIDPETGETTVYDPQTTR
jgi:hypothetical protein